MKKIITTVIILGALGGAVIAADEPNPYPGYPYSVPARQNMERYGRLGDTSARASMVSMVYTYGSSCKPIGADLHDALRALVAAFIPDKELIEANKRTDDEIKKLGHDKWCAKQADFVENVLYRGKRP